MFRLLRRAYLAPPRWILSARFELGLCGTFSGTRGSGTRALRQRGPFRVPGFLHCAHCPERGRGTRSHPSPRQGVARVSRLRRTTLPPHRDYRNRAGTRRNYDLLRRWTTSREYRTANSPTTANFRKPGELLPQLVPPE